MTEENKPLTEAQIQEMVDNADTVGNALRDAREALTEPFLPLIDSVGTWMSNHMKLTIGIAYFCGITLLLAQLYPFYELMVNP